MLLISTGQGCHEQTRSFSSPTGHPNVSRILVVLRRTQEQNSDPVEQTYAALRGAEGLLRTAIAEAIHRKRTPHLAFALIEHDVHVADQTEKGLR